MYAPREFSRHVAHYLTGTVYEKRLIEAYISENGVEPSTGEVLTTEDLIQIKSDRIVRPRPPTLTSIPSLLGVFQEEWDALALETFALKKSLVETRQELSTALYQHDAAVRVIARLTKERDEARDALSKINVGARGAASNGDAMQVDSSGLSEAIIDKIENTQEKYVCLVALMTPTNDFRIRLSKTRRKRPVPDDWATSDDISSFTPQQSSESLYPGCEFLSVDKSGDLALVGGVDGTAGVYSISQQRVVQALKGGGGPITNAKWAGSRAVVATQSGLIKIFEGTDEITNFTSHAGSTTGIDLHPSGDILASVGDDKSYVLYDLESLSTITQVYTDSGMLRASSDLQESFLLTNQYLGLTCTMFHPDGHLLACGGMDGQIKIFDVKTGQLAATFASPNNSSYISSLSFSENGTWLASTSSSSANISIWDLRKSVEIHTIETGLGNVDCLSWDYTGQFLAVGGEGGVSVQQYSKASKEWSEPLKLAVPATGIAWVDEAKGLVTVNAEGVVTLLRDKEVSD